MLNVKNISINSNLSNINNKKKQHKKSAKKNIYNSVLISPQKVRQILENRKKTKKNTNYSTSLKDRQKKIQEQIQNTNNFKDLYKSLQSFQSHVSNDMINNDMINNDISNNDISNNDISNDDMINNDMINNDISNNDISTDYHDLAENMNYEQIVNVRKISDLVEDKNYLEDIPKKKETKISFNIKKRQNPKKTKRTNLKLKSQIKNKKFSKETIDKFFMEIHKNSNKKTNKRNDAIMNLVKILKKIIASNNEALINKFIKKIRRHHLVNLLSVLNITNKNTKAPVKVLKFLLFVHAFDNIKIIKE